jgi:two-component system, cell cycle sensor histidine kinase and response regulator CckA
VFRILFPAPEGLSVDATPAFEAAPARFGSGTVLLVDDEASVRDVCRRMLERLGFTVLSAADGREAVDLLRSHGDIVRWVLLDLVMPRMDGVETLRLLRELSPGIKVIMSSGYNSAELVERMPKSGVDGFIQKPYRFGDLAALLRKTLSP